MDSLTLLVLAGAAAAGFVQGLSGFAFGLVAMAFWAWSVPPQLAGPMVVFGSLIGQFLAIGLIRRGFDMRRLLPFVVGGLAGIPLGAALLPHIDPLQFKAGVGALLTVFCPAMLWASKLPHVTVGGRVADGVVGFIAGIMGGLGGLIGPAPTLWCTLRGWGKDVQRAVFQAFGMAMHAATLATYAVRGDITPEAQWMFLLVAPAMLIPNMLGARLYSRFSEVAFRRLVLLLLLASGVVLLASSVPKLLRS